MYRIVPWVIGVVAILLGGTAWGAVMPAEPDHAWLFDGDLHAFRGGADGNASGMVGFDADTPFAGAANRSVTFGGSDEYVEMALADLFHNQPEFTVSVWVRSDQTASDRPFVGFQNPEGADHAGMRYDNAGWLDTTLDDVIKVSMQGLGAYESGMQHVQTTEWQHVVMTYKHNDALRLYVDGVLDVPTAGSYGIDASNLPGQTPRFLVGAGPKSPPSWDGKVDELGVWLERLEAEEVQWLYANSLSAIPEPVSLFFPAAWALWATRKRRRRA